MKPKDLETLDSYVTEYFREVETHEQRIQQSISIEQALASKAGGDLRLAMLRADNNPGLFLLWGDGDRPES